MILGVIFIFGSGAFAALNIGVAANNITKSHNPSFGGLFIRHGIAMVFGFAGAAMFAIGLIIFIVSKV